MASEGIDGRGEEAAGAVEASEGIRTTTLPLPICGCFENGIGNYFIVYS